MRPHKLCGRCGSTKELTAFGRDKTRPSGFDFYCSDCRNSASRANYAKTRDRQRKSAADRHRKNRDHRLAMMAVWRSKNRPKLRAWWAERYKKDGTFRLRHTISVAIREVMLGKKGRTKWQEIVGYTPADLRTHLERQFTSRMAWVNYGTHWHVDHIRPVSQFSFPEEVRACWALSNLRPLAIPTNLAKGASQEFLI